MGEDQARFQDVKLLPDAPAEDDEFSGGAHSRIAGAIVSLMTKGEGGKALGLEGSWGSGKSSVIELICRKLQANQNDGGRSFTPFIFDAWAHQGDPIRRVFLQELIENLAAKRILLEEYWQEKLKDLRAKKKTTYETKSEKLSPAAITAILTVPLYPIVYRLLSPSAGPVGTGGNSDAQGTPLPSDGVSSSHAPFLQFVGLLIIAAPYLVLLFTWLLKRPHPYVFTRSWWTTSKKGGEARNLILGLKQQSDQVVTDQTIRDDEATTIEFNEVFDEIVMAATAGDKPLVIIIDNLDRLPSDLIRDAWALMRNFFAAGASSDRTVALKNVWLIVPFDRVHIAQVFADNYPEAERSKPEKKLLAAGFVEKTFQVVMHVAPPLATHWRGFLNAKLKYAFGGEISDGESFKIFRLLELKANERGSAITPREIKAYVNAIATQVMQWREAIPIEYQALFVLYRHEIAENLEKLRNGTLLEGSTGAFIRNWSWIKYLSAAHFNVEPSAAIEVLLRGDIDTALRGDDINHLQDLQQNPAFDYALNDYVSMEARNWSQQEPNTILVTAEIVDRIGIKDAAIKASIFEELRAAIIGASGIIEVFEESQKGALLLLEETPDSTFLAVKRSLLKLAEVSARQVEPEDDQISGLGWYEFISPIVAAQRDALQSDKTFIALPDKPDFCVQVAEAATSGPIALSNFKSGTSKERLGAYLASFIDKNKTQDNFYSHSMALLKEPGWVDWTTPIANMQARLNSTANLSVKEALNLLHLGGLLASNGGFGWSKKLNADGTLYALIELGRRSGRKEILAAAMAEFIRINGAGAPATGVQHPVFGQLQPVHHFVQTFYATPNDDDLLDVLAERLQFIEADAKVLSAAIAPQSPRIFQILARKMGAKGIKGVYPIDFLTKWDAIDRTLGRVEANKLLSGYDDADWTKEIAETDWKLISPSLIEHSQTHAPHFAKALVSTVIAGFKELDSDEWKTHLTREDGLLPLYFALIDGGAKPKIGTGLLDGLKSHFALLINGEVNPPGRFASEWSGLFEALSPAAQANFAKYVRDRLIESSYSGGTANVVASLYGDILMHKGAIEDRGADFLRTYVDLLISSVEEVGMHWLEQYKVQLKEIAESAPTEASELRSRIKQMAAGSEEFRRRLINLSRNLKLPR